MTAARNLTAPIQKYTANHALKYDAKTFPTSGTKGGSSERKISCKRNISRQCSALPGAPHW